METALQGPLTGTGQTEDTFATDLVEIVRREIPNARSIGQLSLLTGGASQQTWAFTVQFGDGEQRMILRRAPPTVVPSPRSAGIETEAALMRIAASAGVPSPNVRYVLQPQDRLGRGFLMDHVEGETIPRKILRDSAFAATRPTIARRLGEIAARIHTIDPVGLPYLRGTSVESDLHLMEQTYRQDRQPRPVFEAALKWLKRNARPSRRKRLVHGDFRNGNLIVGPDGVRAVLDWEVAHLGEPLEDLGYLCINSWRFGEIDKPAGGFGPLSELIAGYEAAGGDKVDLDDLKYWEVLGTLRWGVGCLNMRTRFRTGQSRTVETGMIARRASETEIDLMRMLAPRS